MIGRLDRSIAGTLVAEKTAGLIFDEPYSCAQSMPMSPCIFCDRSMKRASSNGMPRQAIPADRPASSPLTAVPVFRGRVSPVLDTCTRLCLLEPDGQQETARRAIPIKRDSLVERVREIQKLGIGIIICGAVSDSFYNLLKEADIHVVCGITGDIDEVIDAYRKGALDQPRFRMPGSDQPA